jgi:hypothetical protein
MQDASESTSSASLPGAVYEPVGSDLFKLTLSTDSKRQIFEHGLSKLEQSQQEAFSVLRNLAKWDPAIRLMFEPRSESTMLDTPFRLIYPNSALSSCKETDLTVRQYMAISYCWRSEDFLPEGYERHGDWPVSKPFVDAMLKEKNHPRVGIWIDQLCIDQPSAIDKQKSVAAMDIIYRSCLRMLILMEDVYLDEAEAALAESDVYDVHKTPYDRFWTPPVEDVPVIQSFVRKVGAARWWERAWCFHEFNVNEPQSTDRQSYYIHQATFILNGPKGSTVKLQWRVMSHIMSIYPYEFPGRDLLIPVAFGDREPGWRSSLMARHNGVLSKGCLYAGDRISVMINMCGLGIAYRGQALRTTDEILYTGALLALAAGEAHPLNMFNSDAVSTLNGEPSWLSQNHAVEGVTVARFKLGGLHGIHRVSMKEIELDMVLLPKPNKWIGGLDLDTSSTRLIFPDTIMTISTTRGHLSDAYVSSSRSDEEQDEPRRRFLASCILNGYEFTASLWAQLYKDVVEANYNVAYDFKSALDPDLLTPAHRLLEQLLPVTALLGIPPPAIFTLEDAHLFLNWLTDSRSGYYINLMTRRIQCTIDGRSAFTTGMEANANFWDGPPEELRAAIPTDVLNVGCIPLRIWLLRPGKSEKGRERWRRVGKAMLLGEPDLRKEAEESAGRNDAVVKIQRMIVGG